MRTLVRSHSICGAEVLMSHSQRVGDCHFEPIRGYSDTISKSGSWKVGSSTRQGGHGKGYLCLSSACEARALLGIRLMLRQIISYLASHAHPQMYKSVSSQEVGH